MKFQGVVLMSVRTYLGYHDGGDVWEFSKYAVGIELGEGKVIDYKTGDVYNYITRNERGKFNIKRNEITEGCVYAIEALDSFFNKKENYSANQINAYIRNSEFFNKEYKNTNSKGIKVMKKIK